MEMFCLVVLLAAAPQIFPDVKAADARDIIDLYPLGLKYYGFLDKKSRLIYMVSTYSNKKNWYKSVEECRKVDAEMFNLTHAITKLNSVVKGHYYIDGMRKPEGNWVSHTGKNLTFDLTLWGPDQPNCAGRNCCMTLRNMKIYDYYCAETNRFICQRNILPFLRLPKQKGKIELQYQGIWGSLCFNLGLSTDETGQICQRQYKLLYTTYRNAYIYPMTAYRGNLYDNYHYICHSTELHCKGDPPEEPVFTIITTSDKIYAGEDIILSCSVDGGIPKPVISLEKNGQYMKTEETWQHSRDTVVFVRNTSFTLSYDDNNATVKCIVNYNGDVLYQQNATLNVMYPPIITVQDYVEVNETDDVVIKCTVTSNPASPVWWTRPNDTDKSNDGTLNLTSIYRNAIGSYICNAENEIDSAQNTTVIYINAPPKLCLYQYEATEENQTVQMKCSGTGIPTPNITWHNSSELITDMVIQTGIDPSNSYLVVSELKVSVSGNDDIVGYRCMITNEHGKAQKTFRIRRKLKCRCRSRILKNCAPLEFTPVELKVEMEDTEKILTMKKEKLTVHKMKMISGHDGRSSSFLIGTVGVIVLVTLGVILIVFDLCGYFVINRKIKPA